MAVTKNSMVNCSIYLLNILSVAIGLVYLVIGTLIIALEWGLFFPFVVGGPKAYHGTMAFVAWAFEILKTFIVLLMFPFLRFRPSISNNSLKRVNLFILINALIAILCLILLSLVLLAEDSYNFNRMLYFLGDWFPAVVFLCAYTALQAWYLNLKKIKEQLVSKTT